VKLSLSVSELLGQLQTVTRVASSRSAVQALSGVMISADQDSQVELRATDMEIAVRVPLQAEIICPGAAVLPARLLLSRKLFCACHDRRRATRRGPSSRAS